MAIATERAFEDLVRASALMPSDARAASQAARVGVLLASGRVHADQPSLLESADRVLTESIASRDRAGLRAQLGSLRLLRADLARSMGAPEAQVGDIHRQGIEQLERACALAPYNPRHPTTLAMVLARDGATDKARQWAERALELDRATHLDPLSTLPEHVRRRLEPLVRRP